MRSLNLASVALCLLLLSVLVGCGCNSMAVSPDDLDLVCEGDVVAITICCEISPFHDTITFSNGYMVSEMHLFVLDDSYSVVDAYNISSYHYLYKWRGGLYYFLTQDKLPQAIIGVKL